MKMFEYMAAKKSIVSSDLPVIKEVLNERNSILVKPDEIKEWSNAINKLYKNKKIRDTLSKNSYNCFIRNYTWQRRVESIKNIIGAR